MNVYFLGPASSYSHAIAEQVFEPDMYSLVPAPSFQEIYAHVSEEDNAIGVIPVENSITSSVHENIDWLFSARCQIVGEGYLAITLHLLGASGAKVEQIKEVYSHPKALMQCSDFLASIGAAPKHTSSTADAAEYVARRKEPSLAALGSAPLAGQYSLEVLKANVGNDSENFTRFLFVSQSPEAMLPGERTRLTATFQLRHEAGALVKVLSAISETGSNLTMIESRPIPARAWEYNFWIELELQPEQKKAVIEAIRKNTLEYRVVGHYSKGQIYRSQSD